MKNNLFKLTALLVVVVGLAACQRDVDVLGISTGLALENMPGYYTLTEVDSATMTVVKTECYLAKRVNGIGNGHYRVSKSGMCTTTDVEKSITWDAVMAENKLSMTTTIAFEDGETKVLRWSEGVLHDGENVYQKTGSSSISSLKTIYEDLANTEFEIDKKAYYPHPDTIEFLAWKTDVTYFAPEDTAAQKQTYLDELVPYMDTIKWYVQNIGQVGTVYVDSVTGELMNLVVVSPQPASRGANKGKHGITHVVMIDTLQTRVDQVNDRPKEITYSTLAFKRAGETNTGSYVYHHQTWTEECYTDPTSPAAIATDSTYTIDASAWAITAVTSNDIFDVLFKGLENGKTPNAFNTVSVSEYNRDKGELVVGTLKYLLKQ